MTASAAAGSAAAGGAAAPVPLPVRPPRPLSARPLAAVGCGLAEAGRRPAAAGEGWGRCRFPYPAALCSGPKRAGGGGGGGAGPRGGSEPGQAAFVAPASRSVAAKPPGGTAQSSSCPGCSSRQRARALRCTVPAGEAQPHRHAHVFGVLLT